ncbi:glycosyltransferase family 2 protein [Lysinibacillus sp. NPDC098008]|uniref:glycosyltransferase family 2 protein n=1 Tax=Lysinibacillus sp. NPDC098008 TaxID=3364146 RepID=UPI0038069524
MNTPLSIVITTYNREKELRRCIKSIIQQKYDHYEIIVVDDHSSTLYQDAIKTDFPDIRYFYQEENSGPGGARNRGIQEAKYNYVVIIDDDDIFVNNALKKINNFLVNIKENDFPVYNFLVSNVKIQDNQYYSIITFKEFLGGKINGDLTPVINKKLFYKEANYRYPESKIGAESLLWYQIAIDYGFPIINDVVVNLMSDASQRLTDVDAQIKNATLFADYQRKLIHNFEEEIIKVGNLGYLISRYRGVIIYSLLEGDRKSAFKYLIKSTKYSKKQILFMPLFILPKFTIKKLLHKYRARNKL